MAHAACGQVHRNKIGATAAYRVGVNIADVGAIIDVSFAADALSNTNIAIAGDRVAGMTAHSGVVAPGYVIAQCNTADGRVANAGCIEFERLITYSRVEGAGRVVGERNTTDGRVAVAVINKTEKCLMTYGGVAEAGSIVFKRGRSNGCVSRPGTC